MQLFATFVNNKCNSFKFLVQQKLALVITQEKDEGIKMTLSCLFQQNVSVELHMIKMMKQFSLHLGGDVAAS